VNVVLWCFAVQAMLGAFDTVYYHEWRARLAARGATVRAELDLHGARSLIYAVLFGTLPWLEWRGALAYALFLLVAAEIVITLADFVVEDTVRKPLGGVFPGERVTHAMMAIIYGGALIHLAPAVWRWRSDATGFALYDPGIPSWLRVVLALMAVGVGASGVRDLLAARGVRIARWPFTAIEGA
jgi:hypothetical protein